MDIDIRGEETRPEYGNKGLAQGGADRTKQIGRTVRHRAFEMAEKRKDMVADRLDQVADRIERLAGEASDGEAGPERYIGQGAGWIRDASSRIREKSPNELYGDLENGIRRRPGVAVAGALAAGFLLARLFRD